MLRIYYHLLSPVPLIDVYVYLLIAASSLFTPVIVIHGPVRVIALTTPAVRNYLIDSVVH